MFLLIYVLNRQGFDSFRPRQVRSIRRIHYGLNLLSD